MGVSRFFVENFLPLSAENFRRGVPFSVSRISGIEKVWVRGGREYENFPSGIVCLTVPKISVEEIPLVFHYFLGIKKIYASEGYVTTFDFLSKIFCLTVPKCFVGEQLCAVFQKI